MKGLARAALEKARLVELENRDLRGAHALASLNLKPRVADDLMAVLVGRGSHIDAALQCEKVKSEISELSRLLLAAQEENAALLHERQQLLQAAGELRYYEDPTIRSEYLRSIEEAKEFKPLIAKLRAQITAMEFDWTQAKDMRDALFDYDDKLREHEMVANTFILKRRAPDEGVKIFASSRRHMLEILVEDRNRNINGHYTRRVVPLERRRVEKDAEMIELRRMIRMYELRTGVCTAEFFGSHVDQWLMDASYAEARFHSLVEACSEQEAKLDALQHTVRRFEDHASEWRFAHDQAISIIRKAEQMRAEYEGMMTKLREEDAKLLAKKKEMEKGGGRTTSNPHVQFTRLREISEEMDDVEGEIAAKEVMLQKLRIKLTTKEKALESELKTLKQFEDRIAAVSMQVASMKQRGSGMQECISVGCSMDEGEEEEAADVLSLGFSSVCV